MCSRLAKAIKAFPGRWAPQLVGVKSIPEGVTRLQPVSIEFLETLRDMSDEFGVEQLRLDEGS